MNEFVLVGFQWAGVALGMALMVAWEFIHPWPRWQTIWGTVYTITWGAVGFFGFAFYQRTGQPGAELAGMFMGLLTALATTFLYTGCAEAWARRQVARREAGK